MPRSERATVEIPERVALRAYSNHDVDEFTGCHISRYSVASHGYAQVGWRDDASGRMTGTTAHRAAWTHVHGQIPLGMTVDHTCKNRRCVKIEHLRLLSNYENGRRTAGRDWPLGECINGHPNSELRTAPSGKRECRLCKKEWGARYRRNNPDKVREMHAAYYARNIEELRRKGREAYHAKKNKQ